MHDFKIATGRSNPELANRVANILGIDLSETTIQNFSDGEIWVKFEDNVRGIDLFIIQSTFPPSDNIFELLMLIDAAKRASVKRVTAVIPYYGYSRQDRKDQPRVSITAKLVANLLERAGADRVITIDLHSSQIQGFFDIPLDNLYASPVLIRAARKLGLENIAVAAPDVGSVKTARAYAKRLENANLVIVDKRRPQHNVAEVMNVIGDPSNKHVFIVDDMIDTGTTFIKCAEALKDQGALDIFGICVHPVLSGDAIDKLQNADAVKNIFVTDTIPLKKKTDKFIVASVAELLSEAIIRTHDNRSISSLFEIER
ncbi:MAG: ribose-phosphate diphosphokinase [Candidatus Kapaibacteriota bacterium]|jgi:ribose-phosphate pyrophosphokinase